MTERYFDSSDCNYLAVQDGPGLLLAAGSNGHGSPIYWRTSQSDTSSEAAIQIQNQDEFGAITMVGDRPSNRMDGLALTFSSHLNATRLARTSITSLACITSIDVPLAPADCVRIPHMVTTKFTSELDDAIVWELQTETQAEMWLGAALPDLEYVEDKLPQILRLRRDIRGGSDQPRGEMDELKTQLSRGRYLSILFVYQHIDMLKGLLDEIVPESE